MSPQLRVAAATLGICEGAKNDDKSETGFE